MNVACHDHDVRNLVVAQKAHDVVSGFVPLPLIVVAVSVRSDLPQAQENLVSEHLPFGGAVPQLVEQPCLLLGSQDLFRQIGIVGTKCTRAKLLLAAFDPGVEHDDVGQVPVLQGAVELLARVVADGIHSKNACLAAATRSDHSPSPAGSQGCSQSGSGGV